MSPRLLFRLAIAAILAATVDTAPAVAQKVLRVKVPEAALQYGPQTCTVDSASSTAKEDSLVIGIFKTLADTVTSTASSDLLVRRGPGLVTVLQAGEQRTAVKVSMDQFRGEVITITDVANRLLCLASIPAGAPSEPENERPQLAYGGGFTVRTGVEFASGNGFSSQQTRIPVAARWDVPLPTTGRILGVTGRPSLSLDAEFTSAAKSVVRNECSGFVQRPLTPEERSKARIPDPPANLPRSRCVPAVIRTDSTVSFYYERLDSIGYGTTDMIWRSSLVGRWEGEIAPGTGVYWGPVFLASIETVPTGSEGRLAQTYRGGVSLRQLDANGKERSSVGVLVGTGHRYSEELLHPDPRDLTRRVRIDTSRPSTAIGVRLFFEPVDGFYLRGIGEFNLGGAGDMASVAVVRTLDVGALLRVFGLGGGG